MYVFGPLEKKEKGTSARANEGSGNLRLSVFRKKKNDNKKSWIRKFHFVKWIGINKNVREVKPGWILARFPDWLKFRELFSF